MKKKKFQEAERYIAGSDKDMKEKLEFVKTQSTFLEKVLAPLERQKEWCQLAIQCFQRSAMQFPLKALSEGRASEAREWTTLPQLKEMKQLLTQEQMKAICQSIAEDSYSEDPNILPESVIIDLEKETVTWHELMFLLDDSVIEIEFFSTELFEGGLECFEHHLGDKIKATVYIQKEKGSARAFLKATGDDGKDYFFELSHFSMLYLLDRDRKDMDDGTDGKAVKTNPAELSNTDTAGEDSTDSTASEGSDISKETGSVGMFTLFNKRQQMMFITTY